MEKYLDNFSPTIEEVRRWGYDDNIYFMEQDEDLILHSSEYISILIELSSDINCPKNIYCLSILTHFSQLQLVHRNLEEIENIFQHLKQYKKPLSKFVDKWASDFLELRELIANPRPLKEEQLNDIAFKLIVGDYGSRDFKKIRNLSSGFVEYLASTPSYKEYFYINPNSSFWKSSKHFPLNDENLE